LVSSDAFVIRISDEKAVVVAVVDGMADVDLTSAELHAVQLIQFVARVETFVFGHVLVFAVAAGGGNHDSPRWQLGCQFFSEVPIEPMNLDHWFNAILMPTTVDGLLNIIKYNLYALDG
jgi:hypothetical protein